MRRIATLVVLMTATTLLTVGVAFTQAPEEDADPYIVVLEDSVGKPSRVANEIDQRQEGFDVGFVYTEALEGFSAEIPDDSLADVRNNSRVAYVERDKMVTVADQALPWGVNRIDADRSSTRAGTGSGPIPDVNFHGGRDTDCDGHGTHVAGTLAAKDNTGWVVGVAPGAPLTSVKVLGCGGGGVLSTRIKGVEWVTINADKPAIANMSLSAGASKALDGAVKRSAKSGVFYSVAAGNQGRNACKRSPARAGAGTNNGIVTIAATSRSDKEASWSNFGRCVDLWAPGKKILSTKLGGGNRLMSGTSMAAPHAGGTAALYLSSHPHVPSATVESVLRRGSERTDEKSKDGRRIRLVDAGRY